jgi:hypothetical protein
MPAQKMFSNDTPPAAGGEGESHLRNGTLSLLLGVLAFFGPPLVFVSVFPAPGAHMTSVGVRGLAVLGSGLAPAIGALITGVSALRSPERLTRSVVGAACGALAILWTGLVWFVAFFVGY